MAIGIWRNSTSRFKRFMTIGAFFILALIITIAGTLTPLTSEEASSMTQELDAMREVVSVQMIFGNNMMISMLMFVPIVGPLFGSYVLYNTGLYIGAETAAREVSISPALVFLTYFIFPFAWLEFIAYSMASAASVWLTWRIIQRKAKHEIVRTCIFIAICAVLLLIGAAVEVVLIGLSPA
jgi:uncharacterized membrane protein SpoIIM required for sporulation